MTLTGLAFPAFQDIGLILLVAFIGTVNPSTGDIGVLVPLEHSMLARSISDQDRTKVSRITVWSARCRWPSAHSRPLCRSFNQ